MDALSRRTVPGRGCTEIAANLEAASSRREGVAQLLLSPSFARVAID
jgi:hypothetical protein